MAVRKKTTPIQTKKKKLDRFVCAIYIYFLAFVVTAWVTFWIKGEIPEALIQYGLGGGAVELACTAAIEILSNKKGT